MADVLRIGQLAECTGVSVDTIRHYERLGLLPKATRTSAGYRQYPLCSAKMMYGAVSVSCGLAG
jgi:MerR family regulatory protein